MFTNFKLFNKFKDLKIQHQILLLVALSAAIPATIVGLFGVFSASDSLGNIATSTLQEEVNDKVEEFDDFLDNISSDVLFISKLSAVQEVIQDRSNADGEGTSVENSARELAFILEDMMSEKQIYMQLRYIDETGQEQVRVDSDGNGEITIVPSGQLQSKADRGYFIDAMKLETGGIYVSPVELNREEGEISEPYTPVIRYATPVVDEAGQNQGLIVANVFADPLIQQFSEINETDDLHQNEDLILINEDGYYIYHADEEKTWGFEFGRDETLSNDYAPEVVEEIMNTEMGVVDIGNYLLSHHQFNPDPNNPSSLTAIAKVSKNTVFSSVQQFKLMSGLAVLISLGVGIPIALFRGRQLVGLLEKLSTNISTSSQEMATTIAEQERVASQQAASVNETTTTMDELEASSRHAAEQAMAAVEAAKKAFSASEDGSDAVEQGLERMFALEKNVHVIAEQVVDLSGQASEISSISQLVIDFANQTNMLALNSSVEAVRAGEHGKGFAVVANEIRKLADQSQQSADKINDLVSAIQKSINETVMVTEEGTKTVKTGVEIAKQTEQAFSEVKESVNQVVLNNQQVSLNLKQQVDAIRQVVDAMEVINRGAKETASGLNQSKVGTEQLNDAALVLQQMV